MHRLSHTMTREDKLRTSPIPTCSATDGAQGRKSCANRAPSLLCSSVITSLPFLTTYLGPPTAWAGFTSRTWAGHQPVEASAGRPGDAVEQLAGLLGGEHRRTGSILDRRLLNVIHDDDFHRPPLGIEPQAELRLYRGKDAGARIGGVRGVGGH